MHYRWSYPEQTEFLAYEWGRMSLPQDTVGGTAEKRAEVQERMKKQMTLMSGSLPGLGIPGIDEII